MFLDDKDGDPVRKDYLTPQNSNRIFGHWFDAQGNPTKHNPEQITRAAFDLRYMHHLHGNELQIPVAANQPSDGVQTEPQVVGATPPPPAVHGSSTDTTPGPLLRNFQSSTLTDGTFLVHPNFQTLTRRLLDRKETGSLDAQDNFDKLDPGLFAILPGGIDITTVEILTFFPGYLKDPFFLYRCTATG